MTSLKSGPKKRFVFSAEFVFLVLRDSENDRSKVFALVSLMRKDTARFSV